MTRNCLSVSAGRQFPENQENRNTLGILFVAPRQPKLFPWLIMLHKVNCHNKYKDEDVGGLIEENLLDHKLMRVRSVALPAITL